MFIYINLFSFYISENAPNNISFKNKFQIDWNILIQ